MLTYLTKMIYRTLEQSPDFLMFRLYHQIVIEQNGGLLIKSVILFSQFH